MSYGARAFRKGLLWTFGNVIGTVTGVCAMDPVAALTFDDGPDAEYTPRLLSCLEQYHARATFFLLGQAAQNHPDLVRQIAEAGHAIGNHSWDHPSFPGISGRERRAQIRAGAEAIAPYGQRLFRPPYGHQSIASRIDALRLGYKVIMFDVWADDWCGGEPQIVAQQLERRIHPGAVIVLHDRLFDALDLSYFNREPMLKALEIFLDRVGDRFRFVTVPELLRLGRSHKEIWYKQSNVELLNRLLVREGTARRYMKNESNKWLQTLLTFVLNTQVR
jgi:peptidoglycan/xylan/chitin deacetylase (PgdA/CDA1 family)